MANNSPSGAQFGNNQNIEVSSEQSLAIFQKKFTTKDEKKILKALLKTGYTCAAKEFWSIAHDSLQLSFCATQDQVYRKVRRLKDSYFKRMRSGNDNLVLSRDEHRLHKLSHKIWGNEARAEAENYKKKSHSMDLDFNETRMGVQNDSELLSRLRKGNYLCSDFPVLKALDSISGSKRAELEKKWDDLLVSKVAIFARTAELIKETVEAASGKDVGN